MKIERIKVLDSHAAYARFLSHVSEDPVGEIPRQANIPSPYAFSSVHPLWQMEDGRKVIIVETRHRHYEVFEVSNPVYAAAS